MTATNDHREDGRVTELAALEESARNLEAQLESLPQQRLSAEHNLQAQRNNIEQRRRQIELERLQIHADLGRIDAQHQQALASLNSHEMQLQAEQARLEREVAKPEGRRSQPVEVTEAELEGIATQLGQLPAQRAAAETGRLSNRSSAEDRLRQLDLAQAETERDLAQAQMQFEQATVSLDQQGPQIQQQLEHLRAQIASLESGIEEARAAHNAEIVVRERAEALEAELTSLREERAKERAELQELVEASRDVTSGSAAEDLGAAYSEQAERHRLAWWRWLAAFFVSVLLAATVGAVTILELHPDKRATTSEIVTAAAAEILVIGLLLYLVRIAARQFSAHRHLEAVDRSKTAALQTFNRMVSASSDPAIRTALASVLAQAVFVNGETGFLGDATENVTLIERAIAPVVERVSS
jgi:hypothetical protein